MIRHGTNQIRPVYTGRVNPFWPAPKRGGYGLTRDPHCATPTSRTVRGGSTRVNPPHWPPLLGLGHFGSVWRTEEGEERIKSHWQNYLMKSHNIFLVCYLKRKSDILSSRRSHCKIFALPMLSTLDKGNLSHDQSDVKFVRKAKGAKISSIPS